MFSSLINPDHLPPADRSHPEWTQQEGFTFIGDWANPLYGTRRGWPISVDDGGIKAMDCDPETMARDAAKLGCNSVILSCGLDLSVESPQDSLEPIKQKIEHAHKRGLRVGVYLRADYFVPEAGNTEERKLERFVQRDQRGIVPTWDSECHYKKKLCYHNPEVLEHFKGRVKFALKDLGADFIHIDGYDFGGLEGMDACRCDRCKEDFRAFLNRKYADDQEKMIERYGHAGLDGIDPPTTYPQVTIPRQIRFASWQDWIEFRCWFAAKMGHEIAQTVHQLNPEAAVDGNIAVLIEQNHALLCGQDLSTMGRYSEGMFCEDAFWPTILEDGKIITRIRQMKMLEPSGNSLLAYVTGNAPQDVRQLRQSMAHMAAFNRGALGCLGFAGIMAGGMEYQRNHDTRQKVSNWVRDHWEFYRPTEAFSELAVWRSQRSLAFSPNLSYAAFMQTEQLLIEDRIPFRIVFDAWLKDHGQDQAVLLPAVDGLSRDQAEILRTYVKNGGGLLIGQGTGTYDLDRRIRRKPLLSDMLEEAEQVHSNSYMNLACYGRGRVAEIFQLVDPKTQVPTHQPDGTVNFCLDHTNFVPPAETGQVRAALDWILHNDRKVVVDAPRGVLAEYRRSGDKLFVHLVNFCKETALNIRLRISKPAADGPAEAHVFSPDESAVQKIDLVQNGSGLQVTLPILDVYAVVVVSPFTAGAGR